jgi:hypothetical protein
MIRHGMEPTRLHRKLERFGVSRCDIQQQDREFDATQFLATRESVGTALPELYGHFNEFA